jgi:hypothetical protein
LDIRDDPVLFVILHLEGVRTIAKTDRCVVRNEANRRGAFSIRQRHNERENESYGNGDILLERSNLNVYYKECAGTYEQEFNRMVDDGTISLRGLKPDAKVFDELVFDVNSAYFENNGGYDYAKQFFAEAYNLAVKEAGGENTSCRRSCTPMSATRHYPTRWDAICSIIIFMWSTSLSWTKTFCGRNAVKTLSW